MKKTILLMGLGFSAALAAAECQVSRAGGGCLKGTCTEVFTVNGKKWAHDKDPGDRQASSRISEKIREACAAGGSEAAFRKRGFRTPTKGEY